MVEDGLMLKGTRIVIPKNKCKQILKMIHEGHLGLENASCRLKTLSISQVSMNS